MAVDSTHPSYERAVKAWTLVRDTAFGGSRVVKSKRETYLPRCYGQTDVEYSKYLQRAVFFNATKRTLAAFRGFIFAENPEVELGDHESQNVTDFTHDATLSGQTLYDYEKAVVGDVISLGRTGTLVEWGNPATDDRPYVVRYATEDILNWRYQIISGRRVLTLLVLRERSSENGADEFEPKFFERYRVARLRWTSAGPYVQYTTYRRSDDGQFVATDQNQPMRGVQPLAAIPFVFHGVRGEEAEPDEIPLEDLAETNIAHYLNSADAEQGRHLCGQPTLVLHGFPKTGEYILGSTKAIVSEKTESRAEFLQIQSASLSAITDGMAEKKQEMAQLGARMLESQSSGKGQEAFETVQIRQSAETSALTDIAIACTETLSRVLRLVVWWDDRTVESPDDLVDDVYIELNTDYTTLEMSPDDAVKLWTIYQGGGISYEVFFDKLQRGGIIPSERKIDDEKEALKDRPTALPDGTEPPPGGAGASGRPFAGRNPKQGATGGAKQGTTGGGGNGA